MPIFNPSKEHAVYDAVEQAVHLLAPNMITNKCLRQHQAQWLALWPQGQTILGSNAGMTLLSGLCMFYKGAPVIQKG